MGKMKKFFKRKLVAAVAVITILAFGVAGCGGGSDVGTDPGQQAEKNVRLLYVQWACASATTHIVADIMENHMGYEVEMMDVAAAAMYQGLASKEADAIFCSWLPLTHGDYMKQLGAQLDDLGPNMEGAKIGLVVPDYVTIDSIEEMNSVKDEFKGQIIGIDPGAGIMQASEQALTDYDLDYELVEGSEGTMIMSLKEAIADEEWIAITGWTPHWKFARWDLKYLDDPKTVYGDAETINTIARLGLKEELPDAYEFFDKFAWTADDLSSAMVLAEELGDPVQAARQWVEQNQDLVQEWLPAEYQK